MILWMKLLPYLIGAAIFGALGFGIAWKIQGSRLDARDKQIGELKVANASDEAALDTVRKQQADLERQRDIAQAKSEQIRVVSVDWKRDNNAIPIAPGCEGAMSYIRTRVPVIVAHRKVSP